MRWERHVVDGVTLVNDAYNANPDSVEAALRTVAKMPGRHVAVLGLMAELGSVEEAEHLRIGRLAAGVGMRVSGFSRHPGRAPDWFRTGDDWLDMGALDAALPAVELTLLVGLYAQAHYLGPRRKASLTETVRAWRAYGPGQLPLPHPSWRNTAWLKKNPWFEAELLPDLRARVADLV